MLHDFIKTNRTELIDRCQDLAEGRSKDKLPHSEPAHGIPIFVNQVAEMLAGVWGDEFLYLLMNPKGTANVEHIANSVLWGIAQPVAVGALEFVNPAEHRHCAISE